MTALVIPFRRRWPDWAPTHYLCSHCRRPTHWLELDRILWELCTGCMTRHCIGPTSYRPTPPESAAEAARYRARAEQDAVMLTRYRIVSSSPEDAV